MRTILSLLTSAALLAGTAATSPAVAAPARAAGSDVASSVRLQKASTIAAAKRSTRPAGANPYLALTPDAPAFMDYARWSAYLTGRGEQRASLRSLASALMACSSSLARLIASSSESGPTPSSRRRRSRPSKNSPRLFDRLGARTR